MNDKFNRAFQGVSKEELDKQDAEYVQKLRSLVGMGDAPTGTDIPQQRMQQAPGPDLRPRESILAAKPSPAPYLAQPVHEKIAAADKINQMKQLQDLEDVGAFEEPNSEVNVRAAKLRALLGK